MRESRQKGKYVGVEKRGREPWNRETERQKYRETKRDACTYAETDSKRGEGERVRKERGETERDRDTYMQ